MLKSKVNFFTNFGLWIFFAGFSGMAISDKAGDYSGKGFTPNGIPTSEIICMERDSVSYREGDNDKVCIDAKECRQGYSLRDCLSGFPCFVCYSDNGCINETHKAGSSEVRFRKDGTFSWKTNTDPKLFNGEYVFDGKYFSATFPGSVTLFLNDGLLSNEMFVFGPGKRFTPLSVSVLGGVNVTYWQCTWQ